MFSLIVSIIALVLVIVLAGAALYYGGDGFNEGTIKAEVARYKNEAQQIAGALVAYQVDNKGFVKKDTNEDGVVNGDDDDFGWDYLTRYGYLSALPSSVEESDGSTTFTWGVKDNLIILPGVSDDVCLEANRMDGYGTTLTDVQAMEGYVGHQQLKATDDSYVPQCDSGLDGKIPCCYDPSNS